MASVALTALAASPDRAQDPKPKPKPAPARKTTKPPAAEGTVLIVADANCRIAIDGEDLGMITAEEPRRITLSEGRHLVVATAADGTARWDAPVEVRRGQQEVLSVRLRDRIAALPPAAPLNLPAGARLAPVAAGTFRMGCAASDSGCDADETAHQVTLRGPFWLMTTEVTVAQFREYAGNARVPVPAQPRWSSQNHPLVNVTWQEAAAFCTWLGGRLPTEAEWERAARLGEDGRPHYGIDSGNSRGTGADPRDRWENTSPTGSFPATSGGFFDLAGNVWEWTADWYEKQMPAAAATDPKGPPSGLLRVVRGGAWSSPSSALRRSERDGLAPSLRFEDVGFRCAADRGQ